MFAIIKLSQGFRSLRMSLLPSGMSAVLQSAQASRASITGKLTLGQLARSGVKGGQGQTQKEATFVET